MILIKVREPDSLQNLKSNLLSIKWHHGCKIIKRFLAMSSLKEFYLLKINLTYWMKFFPKKYTPRNTFYSLIISLKTQSSKNSCCHMWKDFQVSVLTDFLTHVISTSGQDILISHSDKSFYFHVYTFYVFSSNRWSTISEDSVNFTKRFIGKQSIAAII